MKVRLHPEARAELREARGWYFERSPLSATAFVHAVDNAVSQIAEAPTCYPFGGARNAKIRSAAIPFQHNLPMGRDGDRDCCCGTSEATPWLLV